MIGIVADGRHGTFSLRAFLSTRSRIDKDELASRTGRPRLLLSIASFIGGCVVEDRGQGLLL